MEYNDHNHFVISSSEATRPRMVYTVDRIYNCDMAWEANSRGKPPQQSLFFYTVNRGGESSWTGGKFRWQSIILLDSFWSRDDGPS